jgi:hypothetical protein
MATINYLIKGEKNATNILLRFKNGRKCDLTVTTDLKVEPKKWSAAKQKVKLTAADTTKDEVNQKLSELEKFIFDEFNSDNSKGEFIDKHWLRRLQISLIDQLTKQPLTKYFLFLSLIRLLKMLLLV